MTILEKIDIEITKGVNSLIYDEIEKFLIPPFLHPDPYKILVSGTGLTHLGSASARDDMHELQKKEGLTPSMTLFNKGKDEGKPEFQHIGIQPEWFYKGNGKILTSPNQLLFSPSFALDA